MTLSRYQGWSLAIALVICAAIVVGLPGCEAIRKDIGDSSHFWGPRERWAY